MQLYSKERFGPQVYSYIWCVHSLVHLWRSTNGQPMGVFLSFHHLGLVGQTPVTRLGGKHLCLLGHPTGPVSFLNSFSADVQRRNSPPKIVNLDKCCCTFCTKFARKYDHEQIRIKFRKAEGERATHVTVLCAQRATFMCIFSPCVPFYIRLYSCMSNLKPKVKMFEFST